MRKIFLLLIIVLAIGIIYSLQYGNTAIRQQNPLAGSGNNKQLNNSPTSIPYKEKIAIFLPYWTNMNNMKGLGSYDRIVYFGVSVTGLGLNKADQGYKQIGTFSPYISRAKESFLTVRMLESETNETILKSKNSWEQIVRDSIEVAQANNFDGLMLDLELSTIPFSDISESITEFTQFFSQQTKTNHMKFAIALYGDTFYRKRPFDVVALAKTADEVMVMAYDLHKASGEPGPNFPLSGVEKYGYDFVTMLDDFTVVPKEKLTIIFGMYGYDWVVDEQKKPLKPAKAFSYFDIKKSFIDSCQWKNCVVFRDPVTKETEVDYIDNRLLYHIVWFEDMESVKEKIKVLHQRGIGSVAYWAYGYF